MFNEEIQTRKINVINSHLHDIYSETINKVALSPFDDKRIFRKIPPIPMQSDIMDPLRIITMTMKSKKNTNVNVDIELDDQIIGINPNKSSKFKNQRTIIVDLGIH